MNFRRYYVPNSLVFITNVVHLREPVFAEPANMELLRTVLRNVKELHPFQMLAYVFLLEHFHILIRPTGASNFSKIMQSLKTNFTKQYAKQLGIPSGMKFWQKRFYDHVIRDEDDLQRHMDYIHYNPVKHGLVARPEDWPYSSFGEWKKRDAYPDRWGWALPDNLRDVGSTEME